jgi:SAM-dependent MidA family methyltransferase
LLNIMRWNDTGLWKHGVPVVVETPLSVVESEHAARVCAHIAQDISAAGGWISFERYMDLALYAPGLGYYSAGARKLGRDGDFTTAPEISRLFGACVAQQCAEVLRELGGGSILEIGAGSGRLAVDVLTRLDTLGQLPERYFILEVSADLRERQRELVKAHVSHLADRVAWLDELPAPAFDGVILANEVLDALPVVRFRWGSDAAPTGAAAACAELGVVLRGPGSPDGATFDGAAEHGFGWEPRPASAELRDAVDGLATAAGDWDTGYVSEYCPRLRSWACSVAESLRRGAVLWFDYGLPRNQYYLGERHEGTLLCHFRHRAYDNPFRHPGLQDITAWVDFTAVAEACMAAKCELAGFTTQAFFLAGLGIDREMQALAGDDANQFARLANQAKQLMLPGEMGERFKAMAWTRGIERGLTGFALQDLRHTL